MRGRVRPRPGDHGRPVADLVDRRRVEVEPLLVGERRRLARGAGHDEAVGAVGDEVSREPAEAVQVEGPVGPEGCDDRGQDLAQHGRIILRRWPGPSSSTARGRAATRSVEQRLQPDRDPGRQRPEPLEREQDAGDERLARERVVPDRQQLPCAAEEHLLVRDEARAGARSGSAVVAAEPGGGRARGARTARPASSRGGARRSRRAAGSGRPPRRSASSARRRSRSSARRRPGTPALARERVDVRRARTRSCRHARHPCRERAANVAHDRVRAR